MLNILLVPLFSWFCMHATLPSQSPQFHTAFQIYRLIICCPLSDSLQRPNTSETRFRQARTTLTKMLCKAYYRGSQRAYFRKPTTTPTEMLRKAQYRAKSGGDGASIDFRTGFKNAIYLLNQSIYL